MWIKLSTSFLMCLAVAGSSLGFASQAITLKIKDHRFTPATIALAPGEPVDLVVVNEGPGPEEFESRALRVEKLLPEGATVTLRLGALKAGSYDFFGEFHADTCSGTLNVH